MATALCSQGEVFFSWGSDEAGSGFTTCVSLGRLPALDAAGIPIDMGIAEPDETLCGVPAAPAIRMAEDDDRPTVSLWPPIYASPSKKWDLQQTKIVVTRYGGPDVTTVAAPRSPMYWLGTGRTGDHMSARPMPTVVGASSEAIALPSQSPSVSTR
jgi:hypothetical protein